MGYDFKRWGDWFLNRSTYSPDIFRSVPGRFGMQEVSAAPVRIVNRDGYGLSQSNVSLPVVGTEYEIKGIATLSAINVKARGGNIQVSMFEGQSGSVYTLLADGQSLEISALPFGDIGSPVSFYVRTPSASVTVEILGLRLS